MRGSTLFDSLHSYLFQCSVTLYIRTSWEVTVVFILNRRKRNDLFGTLSFCIESSQRVHPGSSFHLYMGSLEPRGNGVRVLKKVQRWISKFIILFKHKMEYYICTNASKGVTAVRSFVSSLYMVLIHGTNGTPKYIETMGRGGFLGQILNV